eukprot:TRINITY_DN38407_c0_g1_i1.p1 TRINITY_DN38407_c0_g1~~TRINITY_DN38407_c0_g1_i1.p1  ORF type:complete len:689 (-),score=95.63 TRINITY_DN38407_c0_g1_i1:374-2296(-)
MPICHAWLQDALDALHVRVVSQTDCTTPVTGLAPTDESTCGVSSGEACRTGSVCRICLSSAESECLSSPCPCRGTLAFVHPSCLKQEFLARREWTQLTCSICKFEFAGPVAVDVARLALERAEKDWGPQAVGTLIAADHLGRLLNSADESPQEAERLLRRALDGLERALGPDDQEVLIAASNLGIFLKNRGLFQEAEPLVRRAWIGSCFARGVDHPETLVFAMNLACVLRELGSHVESEQLLRTALVGLEKERGERHPDTLVAASHLAALLLHLRRDLGEAEPLARRAWEGILRHFGREHPRSIQATMDLGALLLERGRPGEGESLLKDAWEGFVKHLGRDHPQALAAAADLGAARYAIGQKVEAEEPLRAAWEGRRQVLGEGHLRALASAHNLGVLLVEVGRREEALPLVEAAWEGRRQKLGKAHPRTIASAGQLIKLLQGGPDPRVASVLRDLWEGLSTQLGGTHPRAIGAARRLASWLFDWGFHTEAEAVLLRALAMARAAPPEEEIAEQVVMLRKALLDPAYEAERWCGLLFGTAQRPPAVHLLLADLKELARNQERCGPVKSENEEDAEPEERSRGLQRLVADCEDQASKGNLICQEGTDAIKEESDIETHRRDADRFRARKRRKEAHGLKSMHL